VDSSCARRRFRQPDVAERVMEAWTSSAKGITIKAKNIPSTARQNHQHRGHPRPRRLWRRGRTRDEDGGRRHARRGRYDGPRRRRASSCARRSARAAPIVFINKIDRKQQPKKVHDRCSNFPQLHATEEQFNAPSSTAARATVSPSANSRPAHGHDSVARNHSFLYPPPKADESRR